MRHLFTQCAIWNLVAAQVCDHFKLHSFNNQVSLEDMLLDWMGKMTKNSALFLLPFHMMWIIWRTRNLIIFEEKRRSIYSIICHIISAVQTLNLMPTRRIKHIRKVGQPPPLIYPCGFIDGASKCQVAGVGYCIYINDGHHMEFSLGVGQGTNTKAELLSLWAILTTSHMMGIPMTQIYGRW